MMQFYCVTTNHLHKCLDRCIKVATCHIIALCILDATAIACVLDFVLMLTKPYLCKNVKLCRWQN